MASAPTPTIRATTFWLAPHIFARCLIATARQGSSPPTMRDRPATKSIWRPAGRCRRETQVYVAMLSPMIGDRQSDDRTVASFDLIAWARATLFATHPETPPNVELPAAKVQPDRLPSVRRIVDLSALSPQSEGLFVHVASGDRPQ